MLRKFLLVQGWAVTRILLNFVSVFRDVVKDKSMKCNKLENINRPYNL